MSAEHTPTHTHPLCLKVSLRHIMLLGRSFKGKRSSWVVRCRSRWLEPSGTILFKHFWICVVSEHLVRASGRGCGCTCCMNMSLIKLTDLPGGLQLTSARTDGTLARTNTVMHNCMHVWLLIGALDTFTPYVETDRGREGCWAYKPLITSTQIWYHCNHISDDVAYCISGFGQSSVTFVAEKWHRALVPNAITKLASCTLRTVENTDTAENHGLIVGAAYACSNFVQWERVVMVLSDWSSVAVTMHLIIRANLKHKRKERKKECGTLNVVKIWRHCKSHVMCNMTLFFLT